MQAWKPARHGGAACAVDSFEVPLSVVRENMDARSVRGGTVHPIISTMTALVADAESVLSGLAWGVLS
jgi:hypothetical protein